MPSLSQTSNTLSSTEDRYKLYWRNIIRAAKLGGTCSTHEGDKKFIKQVSLKPLRQYLGERNLDRNTSLGELLGIMIVVGYLVVTKIHHKARN